MTLAKPNPSALTATRSLLARLIETPELVHTVQALPAENFATLVRGIGLEDAGEIVALATTEQLVRVFDEDLFVNEQVGERETLDPSRLATWLEVLLEAGESAAAGRLAQLDEDFVVHALSSIVLVIEDDALRERTLESDADEGQLVDKALESSLMEEIDGYLLVARRHEGWDAALGLILALDRDDRPFLQRLLDRLAAIGASHLDDLDGFVTVLNEGESLAEDVEAAREQRRSQQGYVEPRAARAFLRLARQKPERRPTRDALTRAYFRDLEGPLARAGAAAPNTGPSLAARTKPAELPPALVQLAEQQGFELSAPSDGTPRNDDVMQLFTGALRSLAETKPERFYERMGELAYLANVLVAGAELETGRLRLKQAADAAIRTVCLGTVIELRDAAGAPRSKSPEELRQSFARILATEQLDLLFQRASSALTAQTNPSFRQTSARGFLCSAEELVEQLEMLLEPSARPDEG